ncbi:MAG: peptidylprolyl isomerase, partial [Candidatus Cloacimonetes bacterium]|nr:peptidylprolyl isomerase [Candidatus Cloacimonadota bacterium]
MRNLFVFLVILFLFISCIQQDDEDNLAQVNNEKLTSEKLKSNFSKEEWKDMSNEEKREFVQDWIQLTLLAQEADRQKISSIPEIESKIETAEKTIKSNALIAQKLSDIEITEDELFNYYKIHKSKFQTSSIEYKVQRIFTTDKLKIEEIRQEIQKTSFSETAKRYSEEKAGKNGGYIGFLSKDSSNKAIWDVLKSLKKYRIKTIKTDKGYYILRYYDTRKVYKDRIFLEVT